MQKSGWKSKIHFHPALSAGIVALYSNRLIEQLAGGLVGIFLPIFLYEQFNSSVFGVLGFYFLLNFLCIFLYPTGAKIMTKIGLRQSMIIGAVAFGMFYLALYFTGTISFVYVILIALIFKMIWRVIYWIPYHTEFAQFTDRRHRGRQIGTLSAVSSLLSIALPVLGGFFVANMGYGNLFLIATVASMAAIIPILMLPHVEEEYTFGYFETYKKLFQKKNRKMLIAYAADGAESVVGGLLWPIFIFGVLNGNYLSVGAISTAIVFVSVILKLVTGNAVDKVSKRRLLHLGTFIYSTGWVAKIFVTTAFHIFVASTYHSFALILMRTPFDAMMYERAADSGHYVDEYTVLREISLNIGRVIMIGLLFFLLSFVSIPIAFLLAALAALMINAID